MSEGSTLRIVIHLDFLGLGGHMRSATSLARALKARGHDVLFAGEEGPLTELVRRAEIPFVRLALGRPTKAGGSVLRDPRRHAIRDELADLLVDFRADVVHAFHVQNLVAARWAALRAGIPALLTICGGDPRHALPDRDIETIVFSPEQRDFYLARGLADPERIHVIPHRIEVGASPSEEPPPEFRPLLSEPARNVLMIGRLMAAKSYGAIRVIEAVEALRPRVPGLRLLLVGEGPGLGAIQQRVAGHRGTPLEGVVVPLGRVLEARRLIPAAEVCVGVGRSIFEAMARSKPSVVVGPHGYAGTVGPAQIEELAYANFSGRNVSGTVPTSRLVAALEEILLHPEHAEEVGRFGREWAETNLDVREGARRYESVYRRLLRRRREGSAAADRSWRIRRHALRIQGKHLREQWEMELRGRIRRVLGRSDPDRS